MQLGDNYRYASLAILSRPQPVVSNIIGPPGGGNPGGENPGGENSGGENPGGENPGGENPGGGNPGDPQLPPEVVVVPEPGTWALVIAGLLGLAGLERRRRIC